MTFSFLLVSAKDGDTGLEISVINQVKHIPIYIYLNHEISTKLIKRPDYHLDVYVYTGKDFLICFVLCLSFLSLWFYIAYSFLIVLSTTIRVTLMTGIRPSMKTLMMKKTILSVVAPCAYDN